MPNGAVVVIGEVKSIDVVVLVVVVVVVVIAYNGGATMMVSVE